MTQMEIINEYLSSIYVSLSTQVLMRSDKSYHTVNYKTFPIFLKDRARLGLSLQYEVGGGGREQEGKEREREKYTAPPPPTPLRTQLRKSIYLSHLPRIPIMSLKTKSHLSA